MLTTKEATSSQTASTKRGAGAWVSNATSIRSIASAPMDAFALAGRGNGENRSRSLRRASSFLPFCTSKFGLKSPQ